MTTFTMLLFSLIGLSVQQLHCPTQNRCCKESPLGYDCRENLLDYLYSCVSFCEVTHSDIFVEIGHATHTVVVPMGRVQFLNSRMGILPCQSCWEDDFYQIESVSKAYPSMRKNNPPYTQMVKISPDASTIIGSECECKAGNGHFRHSLGLLYLVSHYQKLGLTAVPPVQSKTSLPQTWHIPSRVEGLAPKSVDSLEISKIKPQQGPPKKKKRVTEGILPNIYYPVEKPISSDFSQQLILNLKSVGSDAQILKILPSTSTRTVESTFGPVPFGCPLSYQQKLNSTITDILNHPDVIYPNFPYPNLQQAYNAVLPENQLNMLLGMHVTETTSREVEEQTRLQSHNKTWHDVRKNRITSSVFKDVCSRRSDFAALASRLLKSKNIMTAQMKFGIENEPAAAKTYSEITGNSVYLCGFVINPSAPYLGTSPDRKVFDPNAIPEYGLLEIKCPSKDSFTECRYLVQNKNNHSFKLRTSHGYYFQVIGQMALTGLKWCDFFVKCRHDFHMERISFDQDKWDSMKSSLDKFYFEEMLPQICHKD